MNWTYYLVNNTHRHTDTDQIRSDHIVDLFDCAPDTPSSIVVSISAANWQIKSGLSIRSVFIVYCVFF